MVADTGSLPKAQRAGLPWPLLSGLMIAASLVLSLLLPPMGDMPWRLHVAAEAWAGRTVYADVIEVNPPLWFWAAIPAVALAQLTGLSAYGVLMGLCHLAVAGAVLVWDRLADGLLDRRSRIAGGFALAFGALILPVGEVGQRETAALVAAALWIGLAARRARGLPTDWRLALVAAGFAAYGFALKHYFVAIPVLVELALIARQRRDWRPIRPETLLLGTAALAYGASVVALTPTFLDSIVPLVALSYDGFSPLARLAPAQAVAYLLALLAVVPWAVLMLALSDERRGLVWGLAGAAVVFALVVVLQAKGWRYHALGAQGAALMALALAAARETGAPVRFRLALVASVAAFAALLAGQPLRAAVGGTALMADHEVAAVLAGAPADSRVLILDSAPENTFLHPRIMGREHFSRHYSLWMLAGLTGPDGAAPTADPARAQALEQVLDEFRADLVCRPVDLILAREMPASPGLQGFRPVELLRADPATDQLWRSQFRLARTSGPWQLWERTAPRPADRPCQPLR